ncbi:ABC-type transport auxiliary lipoprotein family protein [Stutzerimonas azotifigens]|uniref:ABC-type transport auxiliary lipoprotein family protein n=1 Tax=Stutzerimonas azotifigens TaxID=291995 RepID=UPI0003FF8C9E|nr:ABC-type transport auxiliary lipoprotein family protein [Stutzerimonas azotifigens]
MTAFHRLLALGLLAALSACSLLPEAEAVRVFGLPEPAIARQAAGPAPDGVLRVDTPLASRMLSGPRIAVVPQGSQISSYAGARWSDAAPRLLRDQLIEALRQSGRVASVVSEESNLAADRVLVSDLRAFQARYVDGRPEVLIRLEAQLADGNRQVLASRQFEVRQPSEGEAVEEVVVAFGQASDRLGQALVDWVATQGR